MYRKTGPAGFAYTRRMPNNIGFFAVHADNLARARRFYEQAFGWRFEPWGPPDFYLIQTGDDQNPGVRGALQKRQEPVTGTGMIGFECTISVDDIDQTIRAIESSGGKIKMPKSHIPTVGTCIYFHDTEGNLVGAMQYEQAGS
jgi:predicted enzyme related to lactoylglutathione lyase